MIGKCQGRPRDTLLNGNTEALQPSANLCLRTRTRSAD